MPMPPLALLSLAALLLVLPRLLRPARPETEPEIRGLKRLLWWINAFYCAAWHRLETERAPLPNCGPALLVSNHTSGLDPMLLQAGCRRVLSFLIAREFYEWWPCRPFCRLLGCIPVRRDGRDLAATRAALRALEEGRVVPIFPEGRILPSSGRELGPVKPGAAFLALQSRAPVIPAYIRGTPPTNQIPRALLTPSHARVVYGPPIDLSPHYPPPGSAPDRAALEAATLLLRDALLALRDRSPSSAISDFQSEI